MTLREFIVAQGEPRDPKVLSKADLVELVRTIQSLMYCAGVEKDDDFVEIWDAGKEINGGDFVEGVDVLMARYALKPKLDAALEIDEE